MCAFNAALDFGKDMIELSASTIGQLIGIQLADLTTFLEHQSVAIYKATEARDVAGLLALQREYREAFWKDRRAALSATRDTLQVASQVVAKSWNELAADAAPTAPALVASTPAPTIAPTPTKARRAAKVVAAPSAKVHDAKPSAPRRIVKKRNPRSRKGPD